MKRPTRIGVPSFDMKVTWILALSWTLALGLNAQALIHVDAKIIETPRGMRLERADCERLDALRGQGVQVLSQPKILTSNGVPAAVSVGQQVPVTGLDGNILTNVQTGVELRITPTLEGESVRYAASAIVRKQQSTPASAGEHRADFTTVECYFSGTCKLGEAVLIRLRPAGGERGLFVYLGFPRESKE